MPLRTLCAIAIALGLVAGLGEPAAAHHVMGGTRPATFLQGALSGLGHPVIGLDHLAAVVAVGCLTALHRAGVALVAAYMVAMIAGAAVHSQGASVPGAELMVALSLGALGLTLARNRALPIGMVLGLFALTGLVHGYALGESITGAEPAPLSGYFIGLAVVQTLVALAAMQATRAFARAPSGEPATAARLVGAGIAGFALAALAQQLVPGA